MISLNQDSESSKLDTDRPSGRPQARKRSLSARRSDSISGTVGRTESALKTASPASFEAGSEEWEDFLLEQWKSGASENELGHRLGISRSSVNSALANARLRRIRSAEISYIDSPEFSQPDADLTCSAIEESADALEPLEGPILPAAAQLPSYLSSLYSVPLLTREQERDLFRRFNYLKFRFLQQRDAVKSWTAVPAPLLCELDRHLDEIGAIRDRLIRSNLRLVVSIARKYVRSGVEFFDLVSDGNVSLMRAVEKFDYMRGNKFSTYATWAVMKNFARSIPAEHRHHDRFRTGLEDALFGRSDSRNSETAALILNQKHRTVIRDLLSQLDEREQRVLSFRFGLSNDSEPETLEQVGCRLGVTKERVRQIEVRSLSKLRRIAERQNLEIPGF